MLTLPAFQLIELRTSSLKYYACFIALLDVFYQKILHFPMRVKAYFWLTPKVLFSNIEGCRSVITKRSISVIDQHHLKWSGLEFFNRARCTTLFARRFNRTRTRPGTSLQAHYASACLNDLLETLFLSSLFRKFCCECRRQLIFHQVCVRVLRSISSLGL